MTTTLLFLHGVGSGDPTDTWRQTLDTSLQAAGYPDLSRVNVIAPKYPDSLKGVDDDDPLPKVLVKPARRDQALQVRREFHRRRAAMELILGGEEQGSGFPVVGNWQQMPVPVDQVRNYISDRKIRAAVLGRILRQLPESGRIVIIGHSLGSVIAADLIRRVNPALEVAGMITIGSPLGFKALHVDDFDTNLSQPPENLGWWVNFWSVLDPVVGKQGISAHFPWVLDHRVKNSPAVDPRVPHYASSYLGQPKVASTIGRALFGSLSKEVVLAPRGIELRLDFAETVATLRLRYAHLLLAELDDDRKDRFAEALRQTQARTVRDFERRNAEMNRPMPAAIARLSVDLTDPDSQPVSPITPTGFDESEACQVLIAFAESNAIQPFEIELNDEEREHALGRLALEMEFGQQFAKQVFAALDKAERAIKGRLNWKRWAAIGLGGTALVIATGGLAMAAAPGAVGAAAVTSALAAFGPGGMIGGLLTAGSLVSAGTGSLAVGLAAPETSADTAEVVVTAQLANVILHETRNLPRPEHILDELTDAHTKIRNQLELLEPVSDPSAASLKDLRHKREVLARAIEHLTPERDVLEAGPA